mmetsp:Transcript_20823/g.65082  ORF Transcript_20823/g.65082 Transcript_20823/m.65082 type:complete len:126 (+) Transcript_20823:57-434(+)
MAARHAPDASADTVARASYKAALQLLRGGREALDDHIVVVHARRRIRDGNGRGSLPAGRARLRHVRFLLDDAHADSGGHAAVGDGPGPAKVGFNSNDPMCLRASEDAECGQPLHQQSLRRVCISL